MANRARRPPTRRRVFGIQAFCLFVGVGLSAGPVQGHVFETVGVRALGMGGAFVAVADDATANYWNPAGLIGVVYSGVVDVQRIDTRLDRDPTRREGSNNLTTFVSLGSPTLGLSYYRLLMWHIDRTLEDGDDVGHPASLTSLVTQHIGITAVQPLAAGVTIATVVKAVRGTAAVGMGPGMAPVGDLFDL